MAGAMPPRPPRSNRLRLTLITLMAAALYAGLLTTAVVVVRGPASSGTSAGDGSPATQSLPRPHSSPSPAGAVVASSRCVNVPILVYHYIRTVGAHATELGFNLSVSPLNFEEQMDWLHHAGAHTITFAQLMQAIDHGTPLPSHAVLLTFDDGHDDFATTAVPILQRDGFVGTAFVVGSFIGRHAYMTALQVQHVAALGMVIGAHTMHHVDLATLPASLAATEITASREVLQQLLHQTVLDFAYPYGDTNPSVAALVAKAGFRDAVTLVPGHSQCGGQRFNLPRLRVLGSESLAAFATDAGVPAPPPGWIDPAITPAPLPVTTRFHLR